MNLELIDHITQLSPPAALAVGLYFVGVALKRSPIQDWLIPFILPLLGALIYPLVTDPSKVSYEVKSPAAFNALVGFCIGGASVALDQAIRQWIHRPTTNQGKTSFIYRDHENPPAPPSPPAP